MPGHAGLIATIVVGVLIVGFRLGLARAGRGRVARREGSGGSPIFALIPILIPLVMIGVAALAGAFSALDTALGLGLAPFTLGVGVALGWFLGSVTSGPSGPGPPSGDRYSFWIFVGLLTLRLGVRLTAAGASPHSTIGTVSADLMLLSVGMAITRLAIMWRRRAAPDARTSRSGPSPNVGTGIR
jgi:hypothetical protein